jgi:hypothetical protein
VSEPLRGQPDDDAQRDFEQRALRNVRGLLDKMEDEERSDRASTVRIAVICGVVAVVMLILVVAWFANRKDAAPASVVIPAPAKTPK